ncbi:MAG: urea ABC transporter permease subunit UrtB [Paracoccaceae bacterium]
MKRLLPLLLLLVTMLSGAPAAAQEPSAIQGLLQTQGELIRKGSRKTIQPAIDTLASSGLGQAQTVLERWQAREMWSRKADALFVFGETVDSNTIRIFDVGNGIEIGVFPKKEFRQLKPNGGVRAMIGAALVRFQLLDPDPAKRNAALEAIERDAEASHLAALRGAIDEEPDATLKARKTRLERLLTIRFAEADEERIAAIEALSSELALDVRATLNPLVATTVKASPIADGVVAGGEIARLLTPDSEDLPREVAYQALVDASLAPPRISREDQRSALIANISGDKVGGIEVAALDTQGARDRAYAALVAAGTVKVAATEADVDKALSAHSFYEVYTGPAAVAQAAAAALVSINNAVAFNQAIDLGLDALSLASIYFLAAIGLAITFGVMGVINMAHGEFIMMGAYTGYVVQLFIPDYTVSIMVALPLAFLVTFGAGVAMERLVIRWLYHRPLETLLATFGISIALQQIAKNIFGTQARPLTAPDWLSGAWVINDVLQISNIRIAIFVMALMFLLLLYGIMRHTRLGLDVRAVTQNPRMAASMGINPDRVNMLTFGLGSGIAGIAGVTIGLYAKVTSEMGQDYIVQSFMTVVVGGVGNIWGTLLGATMVGSLQKVIEWFNPSNTLAAQTYMILFIILFIQFRPRGIIALKGRAAEA